MAKYGRFFIFKRNLIPSQAVQVTKTFGIEYAIRASVRQTLTIIYNLITADAKSLWEAKVPGQALWEANPPENPTLRPDDDV